MSKNSSGAEKTKYESLKTLISLISLFWGFFLFIYFLSTGKPVKKTPIKII